MNHKAFAKSDLKEDNYFIVSENSGTEKYNTNDSSNDAFKLLLYLFMQCIFLIKCTKSHKHSVQLYTIDTKNKNKSNYFVYKMIGYCNRKMLRML